mmetsp:Transcript_10136/g.12193  ORF Transcript_10136/g.12193 Transcript_10136/m.12193 type:complete len:361 (+) Transcript_10136:333-1415(+)
MALKSAEAKLRADLKSKQNEAKLLLLGAGESGKSTIVKQMSIMYGSGFTDKERSSTRTQIFYNLIEGTVAVWQAGELVGIKISDEKCAAAAEMLIGIKKKWNMEPVDIDESIKDAIVLLKENEQFQEIVKHRAKFQLLEAWDSFVKRLDKFPTWGGPDWLPDNEDMLTVRVKTTGVIDRKFKLDDATISIIDVGGQRSERKKWLRLFNGVTGLIFVASLSEYNQVLFENANVNRLKESLELWEKNANRPQFKGSALILFLNKFDLFQQKYFYDKVPIEYDGEFVKSPEGGPPPACEQEEDEKCMVALEWFANLFKSKLHNDRLSTLHIHITTALDEDNMKIVFDAIMIHVLQQNMALSGM